MEQFEDIGSIIGLIALIGIAVFSKIAESKQKSRKQARKGMAEEAWPNLPTHRTAPIPSPERRAIRPDTSHKRPERDEKHAAQRNNGHRNAQATHLADISAVAGQALPDNRVAGYGTNERVAEPSDPTGVAPSEAFDLRRAILYSEILKPRYDTYE